MQGGVITVSDFATNREKLDKIQDIVNRLFEIPMPTAVYDKLLHVDSICDEPLFGANDELTEWGR